MPLPLIEVGTLLLELHIRIFILVFVRYNSPILAILLLQIIDQFMVIMN